MVSQAVITVDSQLTFQAASDKLLGSAMLLVAAFVFSYYTIWALFLVRPSASHWSRLHLIFELYPRDHCV